MRFENPAWLVLLAIIPVLTIAFVAGERRASQNLKRFAAERLLPVLNRSTLWPRIIRHIMMLFAIALIVLALARPSYGYHLREFHSKGADIIFAVDVSRSMLCSDITPDRLTRAKLAARDLLDAAKGHRIGVIPFAGEAFLQCPLTLDADAVRQSLDALDASSIPNAGTSLAQPIAEARKAFGDGENRKILVIFTDGEDLEGTGLKEARATQGITIITVGTGTAAGAPVPESSESGAGYTRDNYGKLVTSRMDSSSLENVARACGGFYDGVGSQMLVSSFKDVLSKDDDKENAKAANMRVPIIRYRWPLAIALIFLAAESLMPSFRKRGGTALLILALALPLSPNSSDAKDAAQTVVGNATPVATPVPGKDREALLKEARACYNNGVALYQKGEYDKATQEFAKAIEKGGEKDNDLNRQAHANAGAAKLALAQKLIPRKDDDEMSSEECENAKKLLGESKNHIEKAMSLAPEDKMLRRNFKKIEEAEKNIEKHKQKPKQKNDKEQKKDEGLPTPKPQEQNPPQNQDQQKQDDKKQQNDKQKQDQSGQSGGSSGSGSQKDQQNQNQQSQQGGSSGSGAQSDKQDQNSQSKSDKQQQNQSQKSQSQSKDSDDGQPQSQSQAQTGEKGQTAPDKQNSSEKNNGSSGSDSQTGKQDQKQPSDNGAPSGANPQSDKQDKNQPSAQQNASSGSSAQTDKQNRDQKPDRSASAGSNKQAEQKDQEPKQQSGGGQSSDRNDQQKPDNTNSGGESQSEEKKKDENKAETKSAAGTSQQKLAEKTPEEKKSDAAGAVGKEDKTEKQDKNSNNAKPDDEKQREGQVSKAENDTTDSEKDDAKNLDKASGKDAKAAKASENDEPLKDFNDLDTGVKAPRSDASKDNTRREGDHTKQLDRPSEAAQTNDNEQQNVAAAGSNSAPQGNKTSDSMTAQDAEQLLRILQKDEKFLPAGQTKEQSDEHASGRDW